MKFPDYLISLLLIFIVSFAIVGGCGGGDDDDGSEQIACDLANQLICERADECGFVVNDECLPDYLLDDLDIDCADYLVTTPDENCMDDITEFSCEELDNLNLPQSCGQEILIEDIPVPNNACGDIFEPLCTRIAECDTVTFDECLFGFLFNVEGVAGGNCDASVLQPDFDQCVEELPEFNCEEINMDTIPESCETAFLLVQEPPDEGACAVCETDEDCPEGQGCFECTSDCTGEEMRCANENLFNICEDGIFRSE